jgi:glycosyltransferase involved in cell wall biosynthesis
MAQNMSEESVLVSILMPAYQVEKFVGTAIESILAQTYPHWELIILDDGSTDNTPKIIQRYAALDHRIQFHQREHKGLVDTLNKGIELAKGNKYIARMDADDIAHPERLETQVVFLEEHPKCGILGTAARMVDEAGEVVGFHSVDTTDLEIRWRALLMNPFIHPTVMMRREVLLLNQLEYDPSAEAAEDYDLWVRILQVSQGENLNLELLDYRIHPQSITSSFQEVQITNHLKIARKACESLLPQCSLDSDDVRCLYLLLNRPTNETKKNLIADRAINKYLELWKVFEKSFSGREGIERLRRKVVQHTARRAYRFLGLCGLWRFRNKFRSLDGLWWIRFFFGLPVTIRNYINQKRIAKLRIKH